MAFVLPSASLVRLGEMQSASAKGASVVAELSQRALPAAKTAWQRVLDRNKALVRDEPPSVLAKQLLFTSMARCARESLRRPNHP